ncbi:uncharacterized protein LOC118647494 [Monomorium pharaonis]|uniref:uncharacterized protein LOC118647494 n=1 Tax=Monomorium pharaonis TaxID=307658 RepID=UPI001747166C|nr:uncharacterized protein LOC118647494 [Monomorium pharaonis]
MGQLPLSRITPSHPFTHTGVNYAGPLIIKIWKELSRTGQQDAQDSTRWEFNSPTTPIEGRWEAVVKSIKYHLRRTIGETLPTFEELTTLLTQIEAILNSRSLEPLSDDSDDVSAFTPGHFLIGDPLTTTPVSPAE